MVTKFVELADANFELGAIARVLFLDVALMLDVWEEVPEGEVVPVIVVSDETV